MVLEGNCIKKPDAIKMASFLTKSFLLYFLNRIMSNPMIPAHKLLETWKSFLFGYFSFQQGCVYRRAN